MAELSKIVGEMDISGIGFLALPDNYLKGADNSSSGAYGFAHGAPLALFRVGDGDNIPDPHYGIASAYINTQPTAVAFV